MVLKIQIRGRPKGIQLSNWIPRGCSGPELSSLGINCLNECYWGGLVSIGGLFGAKLFLNAI